MEEAAEEKEAVEEAAEEAMEVEAVVEATVVQSASSDVPVQGEIMAVLEGGDEEDSEVAQITGSVSNRDHLQSDLRSEDTLVPTPKVSPAPGSVSTGPPESAEEKTENVETPEQPEMILYGIKKINNKRPILHVMDA